MFATLLGPLPRPPLPPDATSEAILEAILEAQSTRGIEPATDGGWAPWPDDLVASWRAADRRSGGVVKAVITGPYSGHRAGAAAVAGSDPDPVAALQATVHALADAGCRWVEVAEPAATRIGDDATERDRFRDLHRRLLDGLHDVTGLHLSLALTGGSADAAGPETILAPPYASLAVDLIAGPDAWRLVRAAPSARGIICGVLDPAPDSDDGPETMVWAAGYAASSAGRGLDRVGLASASSLAGCDWETAMRKLDRLADAARIAVLPRDEQAASLDPRALDSRSAALGRYEPRGPRRGPSDPT